MRLGATRFEGIPRTNIHMKILGEVLTRDEVQVAAQHGRGRRRLQSKIIVLALITLLAGALSAMAQTSAALSASWFAPAKFWM